MAEIRCPMCSKLNPPEAEICQFCQARLKPLVVSPFSDEDLPGSEMEKEAAKAPGEDSSLTDWLNDLKAGDQGDQGVFTGDEYDLPDWTGDFGDVSGDAQEQDEESSELPDWLARIRKRSDDEQPVDQPAAPAQEPDESEAFDDWISEISGGEDQGTPGEAGDSEEGEPDWLRRIRSRKREEEEAARRDISPIEIPDWLSELAAPDLTQEERPEEEVPDWLASFPTKDGDETEEKPDREEIPDWLKELSSVDTEAEAAADWLNEEEKPHVFEEGSVALEADGIEESDADQEIPDWLTELEQRSPSQPPVISSPALIFDDDDIPEEGERLFETPDLSSTPDWLSAIEQEESEEQVQGEEAAAEASVEKGELPSWLEAMRPVEAIAPSVPLDDETASRVEKAGPLAGVRGILPAEAEIARHRKPPTYSMKLQVTENQQAHVALLEGLLANEDEAKALPKPKSISSHALLRIGIALILIAAVIGALSMNGGLLPAPSQNIPVEVIDAQGLVSGLQPNAPVLVAFDFEAGLIGEMEAAAAPVLEQLAEANAIITGVSTTTSGPLFAERWRSGYGENGYGLFFNLGYIPAGQAGLLAFASDPRAVIPYDLNSMNVWGGGPLAGINSVSDFSMVLILTDNPEDARAWIEQVQPLLRERGTPMLLVASAKAEPMIRPYYAGFPKQVSGMVAGVAGAAAYESIHTGSARADANWDAYGTGTAAAAGIILIGSAISAVLAGIDWMKQKSGEEVL